VLTLGDEMHAVYIEVDVEGSDQVAGKKSLEEGAAPMVRAAGGRAGYWLVPSEGVGVSLLVFDTEAEAQAVADGLHVGQKPPGAPDGVTFRTVDVREVMVSL
jgi:hypothetical protein